MGDFIWDLRWSLSITSWTDIILWGLLLLVVIVLAYVAVEIAVPANQLKRIVNPVVGWIEKGFHYVIGKPLSEIVARSRRLSLVAYYGHHISIGLLLVLVLPYIISAIYLTIYKVNAAIPIMHLEKDYIETLKEHRLDWQGAPSCMTRSVQSEQMAGFSCPEPMGFNPKSASSGVLGWYLTLTRSIWHKFFHLMAGYDNWKKSQVRNEIDEKGKPRPGGGLLRWPYLFLVYFSDVLVVGIYIAIATTVVRTSIRTIDGGPLTIKMVSKISFLFYSFSLLAICLFFLPLSSHSHFNSPPGVIWGCFMMIGEAAFGYYVVRGAVQYERVYGDN